MRFRRAEDFVAVLEDQSVVGVRVGRDGEVLEKSLEGRGGVCGHRCGGAAGRGGGERVGGGGVKWWSGGGVEGCRCGVARAPDIRAPLADFTGPHSFCGSALQSVTVEHLTIH